LLKINPGLPSQCGEFPAVLPKIFHLRLSRNLIYCNSMEKFLLQRPEDISSMEECKIPLWARGKMFQHQQGAFFHA
jgi:hypothetical protein